MLGNRLGITFRSTDHMYPTGFCRFKVDNVKATAQPGYPSQTMGFGNGFPIQGTPGIDHDTQIAFQSLLHLLTAHFRRIGGAKTHRMKPL